MKTKVVAVNPYKGMNNVRLGGVPREPAGYHNPTGAYHSLPSVKPHNDHSGYHGRPGIDAMTPTTPVYTCNSMAPKWGTGKSAAKPTGMPGITSTPAD